jgi:23S rRNA pseudouridine1911/1915/1917 synthase
VHGGNTVQGKTVVDFLLEKFPEIKTVGDEPEIRPARLAGEARSFQRNERPGIVHRLDKDTSGVMIVARNQKSFEALKNLFQKRLVEKIYLAIVCGQPREKTGVINLPIGRIVKNPLKRGVVIGKGRIRGEREAITEYRVLKSGEKYSFLELKPKTGRMHQLRVHLKAIGHPVACDKIYGGKKVCCPEGVERQLLHAQIITFSLPEGKKWRFEADLPEDFSIALKQVF